MGRDWWDRRRHDLKEARDLLKEREKNIAKLPQNVIDGDWQDPDNVLSFLGHKVDEHD
jgi:hypothetical protein